MDQGGPGDEGQAQNLENDEEILTAVEIDNCVSTENAQNLTPAAHAQDLQAVIAAAGEIRGGGGGEIQRRVVVVGNIAHLVELSAAGIEPVEPTDIPDTIQPSEDYDPRVKQELLPHSVVELQQTDSEQVIDPSPTPPIDEEPAGQPGPLDDESAENSETMIDTSDFRMSEPTYQTLSSVNGRMTPPGYLSTPQGHHYATLTPLQPMTPLPPISSLQMGEKFGYPVSSPNVSGTFTVMQNNSLAQISLSSPYSYDSKLVSMGMSPPHYSQNNHMIHHMSQHSPTLSPQPYSQNGLHSPHKPISPNPYDYRSNLDPQSPHDLSPNSGDNERSPTSDVNTTYSSSIYTTTPLTSTNNPSLNGMASISPHTISPHPSPSLHHRDLSPPSPQSLPHPSPILPPTTILHHSLPQHQSMKSPNSTTSSSGEIEEINTKELAQRISAELKRYSIPQAIFAQRVLCRSQGTLSDLLRNPKPWSKLKSGRETFRRMFKWLQEPEFQRMSALRLAVSLSESSLQGGNKIMQQSAAEKDRGRSGLLTNSCKRKDVMELVDTTHSPAQGGQASKKPRLVFTDLQRRTLQAIFKETKRPSKEMQITIARQLGLDSSTVSNFFMNARRRSIDKWREDAPNQTISLTSGGINRTIFVTSSGTPATVLTGTPATILQQLSQSDLSPSIAGQLDL
ncbi:hepatocyte nuclear factor 6 isoform X4 [Eurytemora carolleeae]|uniref:hepatocyte nuclear factor 6 isoform X4 n=1 Tax=Eurytemora carolleeae TaxID=1294199 RepID=UPI000C788C33|nr:hepatocyte nuclear factor 6 isoform X4 [Eurytemora carolleeae]|eukprot:XP_023345397.1 hepatocyte nuclear factor 6-like isoform X4 [Eurytemora affinis]